MAAVNGTIERHKIHEIMQKAMKLAEADRVANDGQYLNAPYRVSLGGYGFIARVRYNGHGGETRLVLEQPVTILDQCAIQSDSRPKNDEKIRVKVAPVHAS